MTISEHHAKCIEALQRIALLGDTNSNEYKRHAAPMLPGRPPGWQIASEMRNVANAVVGDIPLSPIFQEETCVTCGAVVDHGSMWSFQCQMCWEAECAKKWHDAMQ